MSFIEGIALVIWGIICALFGSFIAKIFLWWRD